MNKAYRNIPIPIRVPNQKSGTDLKQTSKTKKKLENGLAHAGITLELGNHAEELPKDQSI